MNEKRIILVAVILVSALCFAQERKKEASPLNPTAPPKTAEEMVNFLLPDNLAFPDRLKEVPKEKAVEALTQAQPRAEGPRADAIAFLLVLLDVDVDANRAKLIGALRSCASDPENCDDRVISYTASLFQRGDKAIADPLLDAARTKDSTLLEDLGSTYQDMVAQDARRMMTAISRRPAKEQRTLCHMVAVGDGSGFPHDTITDVTTALEGLARETGPAASTAMMCLTEIRTFGSR